jgi:transcriptional regulator with XRE-family HTH domain
MALALEAEVSPRHVSFLETGRARPSREMLLNLAERLEIPLRDRNALLIAAGFAPVYLQRSLDDPELRRAKEAVQIILKGHEPFPALAIDRGWNLVAANAMVARMLAGVAPELLRPPINVLRLSLREDGMAPRIENLAEWRAHLIARLRRQVDATADPGLSALLTEISAYPAPESNVRRLPPSAEVFVPLKLRTDEGVLSLFSTTTVFGSPAEITLSELAIEAFFPADDATGDALRALYEQRPG